MASEDEDARRPGAGGDRYCGWVTALHSSAHGYQMLLVDKQILMTFQLRCNTFL